MLVVISFYLKKQNKTKKKHSKFYICNSFKGRRTSEFKNKTAYVRKQVWTGMLMHADRSVARHANSEIGMQTGREAGH